MKEENKSQSLEPIENKYLSVIAASRRARQLVDRAEKHNLTVDTEKVIQQALNEFLSGKVTYGLPNIPTVTSKTKKKDKD
jgi:DNA-directed RNA polymerase omega subunit